MGRTYLFAFSPILYVICYQKNNLIHINKYIHTEFLSEKQFSYRGSPYVRPLDMLDMLEQNKNY